MDTESDGEVIQVLQAQLKDLEKKEFQLVDRLVDTETPSLVRAYEQQIERIDTQKIILKEKVERGVQPC